MIAYIQALIHIYIYIHTYSYLVNCLAEGIQRNATKLSPAETWLPSSAHPAYLSFPTCDKEFFQIKKKVVDPHCNHPQNLLICFFLSHFQHFLNASKILTSLAEVNSPYEPNNVDIATSPISTFLNKKTYDTLLRPLIVNEFANCN